MSQINEIKQLLQAKNLWQDGYDIRPNPNRRGQSISYFIYDSSDTPIYIAKFFDFFKGIPIPNSININSSLQPEEVIDMLADADDFMGDADEASTNFYYQKRFFVRYVNVCSKEDTDFPKMFAFKENIIINSHFYGLLIEEAIEGITLEDYSNKPDSSYDRTSFAINFLENMTNIIKKFVTHGIVHRDLSPDNIMLRNQEFIVIDPGVVKIVNRNTTEVGYIMGKRTYASPEQCRGHAVYTDFTSDLYTIGLITFEIISGINPLKYYMEKQIPNPHEAIINKFDRELEDIFFANIEDSVQTRMLFLIVRK